MTAQDHLVLIKLVAAYTVLGTFIFTAAITSLSLIGIVTFVDPRQQNRLFVVLIVELVVSLVGSASNLLNFNVPSAVSEVQAPLQARLQRAEDQVAKKLVYIQIARDDQKAAADNLRSKLQAAGFSAPGIENTGSKSPSELEIRYFPNDMKAAQQAAQVVHDAGLETPKLVALDIPNRSTGALEVWLPR